MGMSASQARLLTLTARLSDLELSAQMISNSKLRLAAQSEKVATDYTQALNRESIKMLTGYNNNGNSIYTDLTYANLTGVDSPLIAQYGLSDNNGSLLVTKEQASAFESSSNATDFMNKLTNPSSTGGANSAEYTAATTKLNNAQSALDTYGYAKVQGYTGAGAWAYSTTVTDTNGTNGNAGTSGISAHTLNSLKNLWGDGSKYSEVAIRNAVTTGGINWSVDIDKAILGEDNNIGKADDSLHDDGFYDTLRRAAEEISTALEQDNLSGAERQRLLKEHQDITSMTDGIDGSRGAYTWEFTGDDREYTRFFSELEIVMTNIINDYSTDNTGSSGNGTGTKTVTYTSQANPDMIKYINGGNAAEYNKLQQAYADAKTSKDAIAANSAGASSGSTSSSSNQAYYTNLYNRMAQGYVTENDESSTINNKDWIQNQLQNHNLILEKVADSKWNKTSLSSDTNFCEETNDTDIARAEAQYEAESKKLETKDKIFDMKLQQINTEHTAIQTEVESVKKVIDKNIERTFKIFDA